MERVLRDDADGFFESSDFFLSRFHRAFAERFAKKTFARAEYRRANKERLKSMLREVFHGMMDVALISVPVAEDFASKSLASKSSGGRATHEKPVFHPESVAVEVWGPRMHDDSEMIDFWKELCPSCLRRARRGNWCAKRRGKSNFSGECVSGFNPSNRDETVRLITMGRGKSSMDTHDVLTATGSSQATAPSSSFPEASPLLFRSIGKIRLLPAEEYETPPSTYRILDEHQVCPALFTEKLWENTLQHFRNSPQTKHIIPSKHSSYRFEAVAVDGESVRITAPGDSGGPLLALMRREIRCEIDRFLANGKKYQYYWVVRGITKGSETRTRGNAAGCCNFDQISCPYTRRYHVRGGGRGRPGGGMNAGGGLDGEIVLKEDKRCWNLDTLEHIRKKHPGSLLNTFVDLESGPIQGWLGAKLPAKAGELGKRKEYGKEKEKQV